MADVTKFFPSALEALQAKADIVIEVNANTEYLGFADKSNPGTDTANWAVCKVLKTGAAFPYTTTIKWSNGSFNKNQIFDDYATLTYKYKNF